MYLVTQERLDEYLQSDVILKQMDEISQSGDYDLICQQWLRDTPAKRLIFNSIYGDLLASKQRLKILDVGGGLTAFTRLLAQKHDYDLVDILAHDSSQVADSIAREVGRDFIHKFDWEKLETGQWDVVIANDIFPNADQRLCQFITKFLPITSSLRLSLTFYNITRSYMVKRIDADEIFTMLAWDGFATAHALEEFSVNIKDKDFSLFQSRGGSLYSNQRHIVVAELVNFKSNEKS